MTAERPGINQGARAHRAMGLFNNIKFFVLCHGMLQLAQLLVSGYLKGSISTIEKRYGLTSQKSGLLASFNEVGNTVLIVFVSYFGSRVHRPRCIGIGAMIAGSAAFLIALPHFFSEPYKYTGDMSTGSENNSSGLCSLVKVNKLDESNLTCLKKEGHAHHAVFPILLLGQLLLGIGGVPIQPFGISYIDDYANKKNSPFYLGILFALTVIGPALGYMMASFVLRFYVDFNTVASEDLNLNRDDPRWVGAWWMGFLIAGSLLFLTSLPYLFFPRSMKTEITAEEPELETKLKEKEAGKDTMENLSLTQFLKKFPQIMLRTLKTPVYLLVVLAQVNLAAMVAGLATFMPKFIERQFMQTASYSNMMIGGFSIPSAMLGIMAGGLLLRRLSLSVKASAVLCTAAVLMSTFFALPLLFLGCPTQKIAETHNTTSCLSSLGCSCSEEAFNPVCGGGVEFRSPCHAGCRIANFQHGTQNVQNYNECWCTPGSGRAVPGSCDNGCSNLLVPFMVLSCITCFLASLSQTPSFMMILRTVEAEDKSFALGIQFMLFRVLAFLPAPVLYGSAIDSTCILWGKKCNKNTSCHYYNMDSFRWRFLGLQIFFVCCALVFFFLSFVVMKRLKTKADEEQAKQQTNGQCEKR